MAGVLVPCSMPDFAQLRSGTGEHEWGRIEHVQFHGKLGSNDERRSKINAGGEQCGKSYQLGYHHHPQKYNYHSKTNNHTGFYL